MDRVGDLFDLQGEVAIVTGGAGVIAGAMAATIVAAGARAALWGRGREHPMDVASGMCAERAGVAPERVIGVRVDTADEQQVKAALQETRTRLGEPTILINGVGGNRGKSDFVDIDLAVFKEVLETNLLAGLVTPLKVCAAHWIANGSPASVVNLASMASWLPLSGVWAYNAAKSAVLNLTQGAAMEFARHAIRVNAIAPGFFVGHQNRRLLIADDADGRLTPRGEAIIAHTPFGRFGEVQDLQGATLFLASRRASGFVTGVTIPVDGGYLVSNI